MWLHSVGKSFILWQLRNIKISKDGNRKRKQRMLGFTILKVQKWQYWLTSFWTHRTPLLLQIVQLAHAFENQIKFWVSLNFSIISCTFLHWQLHFWYTENTGYGDKVFGVTSGIKLQVISHIDDTRRFTQNNHTDTMMTLLFCDI